MGRLSQTILGCGAALVGLAGLVEAGCGGVDTGGLFSSEAAGSGSAAGAGGSTSASGSTGAGAASSSSGAGQGGAGATTSSASGLAPVCGNGVVEAGEACDDGNSASSDGCSSACQVEGATCTTAIAIDVPLGSMTLKGTTAVNGGKHTSAACKGSDGPDRIYALTAQSDGFLTASLSRPGTSYDSALYIAQGCADNADNTALLCANSTDPTSPAKLNGGEVVSIRAHKGEIYILFVDGPAQADAGSYTLLVDLSTGLDCGDPVPIPLEPGTPMTVLGSNTNIQPATQGSCGGMPGGQVVYQITRPDDAAISVDTDAMYTNYNSALYARSTCADDQTELDCSNNWDTGMESITFDAQAGVPVFVWIDGSTAGGGNASGTYGLVLTP